MRVLLTGAGGFVGSHLLRRFLRDSEHTVAVVLRPGRAHPRIGELCDRVEVIPGDLARAAALAEPLRRFSPEIVKLIQNAGKNKRFWIEQVSVKGPDERTITGIGLKIN